MKDRAAASILREAERTGRLRKGVTILDATSGNTGIAYAMISAAFGYRFKLCMPANVTPERTRTLKAFGAELDADRSDGRHRRRHPRGAAAVRRQIRSATSTPISTTTTPTGARTTKRTGPEIIEQTEGRITHFVAGLGTSGTFMGVGRRLREFNPRHPPDFGPARFADARRRRA